MLIFDEKIKLHTASYVAVDGVGHSFTETSTQPKNSPQHENAILVECPKSSLLQPLRAEVQKIS
ncbi:MAG: hypothetical protein LBJ96_03820 [Holosporaceae bacterium]|jgi:hypothetical protein|nr:hypothetical protein [Holosporaceae bacterium]